MQGSWVSGPGVSGSPMPLPGYDRMGNSIGVPLRYYDRMGNEISPSVYSKTNNNFKIDNNSNDFESLSMKKRQDDFSNNFKMPNQFIPEIKPEPIIKFKMPEPIIPSFKPFIPEPEPFKFIDTTPKFKLPQVNIPKIEPFKRFDITDTFKKGKDYDPLNPSTW